MAPSSCTWFCFLLLGLQGVKPLEAPKNLHLTVPKTASKIDQYLKLGLKLTKNTWMVMQFSCALQYKVTGKFQKLQILNSQVSYQNKMYMFLPG